MKRTNLVLDGDALEEARRELGARTYSETVNIALVEAVRAARIRKIPELFEKVQWIGDLSEMREDSRATSKSLPAARVRPSVVKAAVGRKHRP